jgi:hypothetical protein
MNFKQAILINISTLILSGCLLKDYKGGKIISPSRKYYLTIHVNRTNRSKSDYAYVIINLYDSKGQLKSTLNTHAGDASEWAVGWEKDKDTIILFSSDISNNAWKIETGQLKEIAFPDDLNKRAEELGKEKYRTK